MQDQIRKFESYIDSLREPASVFGLKKHLMRLEKRYKVISNVDGTKGTKKISTDLKSDLKFQLEWWRKIFLTKHSFNRNAQKKWLKIIREATLELPEPRYFCTSDDNTLMAEMILNNIFCLLQYKPVLMDSPINWNDNPVDDKEWVACMNRHYFLGVLSKAYDESGDRKYAAKAKELFLDWTASQPCELWTTGRSGWSSLNTAIRGAVWLRVFPMWNEANLLTDDFEDVLLNAVCQNAKFLLNCACSAPSNWRIFEARGLFYLSLLFPSFSQSKIWRSKAVERLKYEMSRQVRKDGCHFQNCPNYHVGMTNMFMEVTTIANKLCANNPFDNNFLRKVEKMCEFSLLTCSPDFKTLPIGDASPAPIRDTLEFGNKMFHRDDFTYLVSKRIKGKPPKTKSCFLKPSGYIVFRSDWSDKARSLLFDVAEYKGCHSHRDFLNIHVHAYGKELVCDSGRTTYQENEKKEFGKTSRHNTVTVDGKDQNETLPIIKRYKTKDNWGYVQAEAHNFEGVRHLRSIFFLEGKHWLVIDTLSSDKSHDYVLNYHTPDPSARLTGKRFKLSKMVICPTADKPYKLRQEKIILGRGYNESKNGLALRISCKARNVRFVTLLATYEKIVPSSMRLDSDKDSIRVKVGDDDYLIQHDEAKAICDIRHGKGEIIFFQK